MTNQDPFSNPNLTFNGKTLEERAKELDREEKARERDARKAELLAKRAAREAEANGEELTQEPEPQAPTTQLPTQTPPINPTPNFLIEELADRYRIHNVTYQREVYVFDWSKELLEGGANHEQKEWVRKTLDSDWQKENGVWRLAPSTAYHSTIIALYNNQNHSDQTQKTLVEKVRQVFRVDFTKWPVTSSRVKYAKKKTIGNPKDTVTHNLGYNDAHTTEAVLIGDDKYVDNACQEETKALFDSDSIPEIINAYEWISGQKPYLYRINSRDNQEKERAVVLGLDVYSFDINIFNNINLNGPARGWSATRANFP